MTQQRGNGNNMLLGQRIAAVGLVCTQAAVIGLLMDGPILASFAILLAIMSPFAARRGLLISLPSDRWILILGVLFSLKYAFAAREFPFEVEFVYTAFAFEVTSFCIVTQLLYLYRIENRSKLPLSFLAFAIVGLVFSADVRLNPARRALMLVLVQMFLIFWAWLALSSRRQLQKVSDGSGRLRFGVMLGVLVISTFCGSALSIFLKNSERRIESLITQYLELSNEGPARAGFSGRGSLSDITDWQHSGGEQIALRVFADEQPGYFRGKAFDTFRNNRWTTSEAGDRSHKTTSKVGLDLPRQSDELFIVQEQFSVEDIDIIDVWPVDRETAGHCFGTLGIVAVACQSHAITIDHNLIVTRPEDDVVSPYTLVVDPGSTPAQNQISPQNFLQLPERIDDRVRKEANEVFANTSSTKEKIAAVEQHFDENFRYRLGIEIPPEEDRLGYFLDKRLPAHCEFFASAAAVLLRTEGVPARYVTGFVVQERNSVDGSWIARRQDAHAWVEAFDEQSGEWITVEATPSEGVPGQTQTSIWNQRREAFGQYFRSIQELVRRGEMLAVMWKIVQPFMWVLAAFGLLIFGLSLAKRVAAFSILFLSREAAENDLAKERMLMDQHLGKFGLTRQKNETPVSFAERIEREAAIPEPRKFANWYRDYSACRYRQPDSRELFAILQSLRIEMTNGNMNSGKFAESKNDD